MTLILLLLIGYNLMTMIQENSTKVYKDLRFWLVLGSLFVLIGIVVWSFPY